MKPCNRCHGAGEVEIRAFVAGASPFDKRIECEACHGTGYRVHEADRQYADHKPRDRSAA
jgi:DnaJ-class molecular chaperone